MRDLPNNLAEALASGLTHLCHCWRLTRSDGVSLGFTDHDQDIAIGLDRFEAASGMDASAVEAEASFASSGGEISGALTSDRITSQDIEAGRYDGARLERWLVDWRNPTLDFLIDTLVLGAITQRDGAFVVETRNALHALDAERGRLYQNACPAELGDAACGIDLSLSAFRAETNVEATDGRARIEASTFALFADGHFTRGTLRIASGPLAGIAVPIRNHRGKVIDLWQGLPVELEAGTSVVVTAGCDKRFATCRDRFANSLSFRGFPLIPSPDFTVTYARDGEGTHQGRPLVTL
jgi:uncharacterized phage protein (TIGR02218 family)